MCRLFFSFRNKSIKPLLEEFLAQSTHGAKYTPNLDNHRDHTTHTDGFGIAWKSQHEKDWEIYKQSKLYTEDDHLDAVLDKVKNWGRESKRKLREHSSEKLAPNNLVIAHIRKKTKGDIAIENTHPFHYAGQIFAQNGKIADFEKHEKLLRSYILRSLTHEIQGETDTECLFFMFLSCKKYLEHRDRYLRKNNTRKRHSTIPNFTKAQIKLYEKIISYMDMKPVASNHSRRTRSSRKKTPSSGSSLTGENTTDVNAFALLTGIFKKHSIELVANIIYANSEIVLISRYIFYDKANYNEKQIPTSLYWNKCNQYGNSGILITSEPLAKYDSVLFPENTVAILDYKKSELSIHKI
uniref:Glutamine amidotransferase type-2 domain-containing protein n=1 Tax=viral metagenome TaxID=1070528 RepID=A0A6C0HGL5_9ZZZZ